MCECSICVYGKEVEKHLAAIPIEHRPFFDGMFNRLLEAEDDVDFYKMKYTALKAEGGSDVNPV